MTRTSVDEPMTAGQMKQLAERAVKLIPANLSKREAELLMLNGDFWTDMLVRYRYLIKHMGPFFVDPIRAPRKWILENCAEYQYVTADDEVHACSSVRGLKKFAKARMVNIAPAKTLEMSLVETTRGSTHECAESLFQEKGYRSATVFEAISFLSMFGEEVEMPCHMDWSHVGLTVFDNVSTVTFQAVSKNRKLTTGPRVWNIVEMDMKSLYAIGAFGTFLVVKL